MYFIDEAARKKNENAFPILVFMTRILVGICEGVNFPAQTEILAKWIPRQERSRAWAMSFAGESLGTVLAMLVCPMLGDALGWESIFYFSAILGFVWLGFFLVLVGRDPVKNPNSGWLARHMNSEERQFIFENLGDGENAKNLNAGTSVREIETAKGSNNDATGSNILSLQPAPSEASTVLSSSSKNSASSASSSLIQSGVEGERRSPLLDGNGNSSNDNLYNSTNSAASSNSISSKKKIPWFKIMTNGPFTVTWIAHLAYNWGWYLMLSVMPSFYEDRYHVKFDSLGFLSVLPYICIFFLAGPIGLLADYLCNYKVKDESTGEIDLLKFQKNTTKTRRFYTFMSCGVQAIFFCLLAYLTSTPPEKFTSGACCALFCLITALGSFTFAGFVTNYQDLSPNCYDAHLMAVGNSLAALSGVLGNLSVGWFGTGDYAAVFLLAAGVDLLGAIPYCLFSSSEVEKFE